MNVGLSKSCKHGSCSTCAYSSANCDCGCHLDGSARLAEPPATAEQRLIAQAAGQARTVETLARELWEATERCGDCRGRVCDACKGDYDLLRSLGFGDAMDLWAGAA